MKKKYVPRLPLPWDMVVFLTITTSGFAFSVQRLVIDTQNLEASPVRKLDSLLTKPEDLNRLTTDLGCLDAVQSPIRLKSELGSIRLRGKFCTLSKAAMRVFEGMQIKNLTNGFEGTVFYQGFDSTFVSDFVVLVPGRNQIEIQWRERAGVEPSRLIAEVYE